MLADLAALEFTWTLMKIYHHSLMLLSREIRTRWFQRRSMADNITRWRFCMTTHWRSWRKEASQRMKDSSKVFIAMTFLPTLSTIKPSDTCLLMSLTEHSWFKMTMMMTLMMHCKVILWGYPWTCLILEINGPRSFLSRRKKQQLHLLETDAFDLTN